jgi:hypothetical protein
MPIGNEGGKKTGCVSSTSDFVILKIHHSDGFMAARPIIICSQVRSYCMVTTAGSDCSNFSMTYYEQFHNLIKGS